MKLAASLVAMASANTNTVVPNCGGTITATNTVLASPGYEQYNYYFNNLDCVWTIDMPDAEGIVAVADHFYLNGNRGCTWDWVAFYNADGSRTSHGNFCGLVRNEWMNDWSEADDDRSYRKRRAGGEVAAPRSSSHNPMWEPVYLENGSTMRFRTNSNTVREGWKVRFLTGETPHQSCEEREGDFYGSGAIFAPGFPVRYTDFVFCNYVLHAEPGKHIRIRFTHFDTEAGSTYCDYDYVEIDGVKYCGNENMGNPPPQEIIVAAESTSVAWVADSDTNARGFRFEFDSVDPVVPEVDELAYQQPDEFWPHWLEFFNLTKEQMKAGDRPWKTPHFTWLKNRIMNEDPQSFSQMEADGPCEWSVQTAVNGHPTYEPVNILFFDPELDRCDNLKNLAEMGDDYIDSYICMTGHRQPRGTLRRWKMWMNGIRRLGNFFCPVDGK